MREIKFRFWDGEEIIEHEELTRKDSDEWCVYNMLSSEDDDTWKSMQYTDLKDINGKEIYEGDIIQFTWQSDSCWGKAGTYLGYISFNKGTFQVLYIGKLKEKRIRKDAEDYDDIRPFMDWSENIKVISNIYERPDLIQDLASGADYKEK